MVANDLPITTISNHCVKEFAFFEQMGPTKEFNCEAAQDATKTQEILTSNAMFKIGHAS